MKKQLEIHYVDPGTLSPNPWNTNHVSPENQEKLEASIKRFGFTRPIVVREVEGTLQIIGGEHRATVAQRMGLERVPIINLGPIDEKRAKEIGLIDNGRYGEDDTLALSELLRELGDSDELLSYLPYSDTDLDQIFKATDISLDDLDGGDDDDHLPDLETVAKAQEFQVMRFKIPMGDVPRIQSLIETTMKSQGLTGDDSLMNAGNALVHLLTRRT